MIPINSEIFATHLLTYMSRYMLTIIYSIVSMRMMSIIYELHFPMSFSSTSLLDLPLLPFSKASKFCASSRKLLSCFNAHDAYIWVCFLSFLFLFSAILRPSNLHVYHFNPFADIFVNFYKI